MVKKSHKKEAAPAKVAATNAGKGEVALATGKGAAAQVALAKPADSGQVVEVAKAKHTPEPVPSVTVMVAAPTSVAVPPPVVPETPAVATVAPVVTPEPPVVTPVAPVAAPAVPVVTPIPAAVPAPAVAETAVVALTEAPPGSDAAFAEAVTVDDLGPVPAALAADHAAAAQFLGETPLEAPLSPADAPDLVAEIGEVVEVESLLGGVTAPAEETPPAVESPPPAVEEYHPPEPQVYRYIPPPLENKYLNKEALRDRFWLRKAFMPIICYIGRLDYQKGVHLIRHAIFYALQNNAQFVLLGTSPEPRINNEFWGLKRQLNDSPDCHLEIGFNEELSHLIYSGSDMVVMPSLYEPCGLTQMIALKYGTVPIVRSVGGLADTVFDRDFADKPYHERNGYVFHQADAAGLESAMRRAIGLWYGYPDEFRQLIINGMRYDYSWNHPGQHYLNIYEYIRCK